MGVRRAAAARAGWGLADQALSSLTNFGLSLVIARAVSPTHFGAFSLAFATYLLAMGVVRGVVAQPLIIRYATAPEASWRAAARQATGAAVVLAVGAAAVAAAVGVVASGPLGQAYLALALTFPGLLLQDSWRFAFLAQGKPRAAFTNDLVWAVVLFPILIGMTVAGDASVFSATLAWGGSATVAALVGVFQSRAVPRPGQALQWWRDQRDVAPAYLGEFAATAGATQAGMFGISAVSNLVVVGALRAAEVLMGPLKTVGQGLRMVLQPEAVRELARGRDLLRPCLTFSVAMALLAAAAGTVLMLLPDSVGRELLGPTWEPAQSVLLPYTVSVMGAGLLGGAQMGLHALVAVRRSLVARIALSVMLVTFKVTGAVLGGAPGAATGGAVAMWAGATLWWWQFLQARRDHTGAQEDEALNTASDPDVLNPETAGTDGSAW